MCRIDSELFKLDNEKRRLEAILSKIRAYVTECKKSSTYDGLCVADSILEIMEKNQWVTIKKQ